MTVVAPLKCISRMFEKATALGAAHRLKSALFRGERHFDVIDHA